MHYFFEKFYFNAIIIFLINFDIDQLMTKKISTTIYQTICHKVVVVLCKYRLDMPHLSN